MKPHSQGGQKEKEGEKDRNGACAPGREPCEAPSPAGRPTGTEGASSEQSAEPAAAGEGEGWRMARVVSASAVRSLA